MVTWDSEQYLRFKRERTQPARDLAMQLPPDDGSVTRVLDIGCGPGNSTAVLRERYPHAKILGVDSSPDIIEVARNTYPDIDFQLCDVSTQLNDLPADFDVVFSNACIQWVPDHPHLIPGLLARLRVGGVLAVQTPMNYEEAIMDWYRGTGMRPYLQALGDAGRKKFEAEVFAQVREEYPTQSDGSIIFPFPRFFFLATR